MSIFVALVLIAFLITPANSVFACGHGGSCDQAEPFEEPSNGGHEEPSNGGHEEPPNGGGGGESFSSEGEFVEGSFPEGEFVEGAFPEGEVFFGEHSDFGSIDFGDAPIDFGEYDFSGFSFESGDTSAFGEPVEPKDFDFSGFFTEFEGVDFTAPDGGAPADFGDFTGVFGGFDSFSGGYHDLEAYGGDIGEIGGFFDRPPDAVEAYNQIFGLSPEDLEALGSDFAHDLIDDLDFFAFYDLDSAVVEDLLHSAEQAGDVLLGGEQWEGILGSLDQEGIFGLSEGLQDSAYDALEGQGFLLLPPDNAEAFFESTFLGEDIDFSAKPAELGDDAYNLLGAADHDYYLEIGDQIDEIFGSIDFSTLDFETSALAGDDIGALIAAAGDGLQDIGGDDIFGAIGLLDITDFHWEGDVAFDGIELVGLDQLIGSDQAEGIFGSFNLENSDLLGDTLVLQSHIKSG